MIGVLWWGRGKAQPHMEVVNMADTGSTPSLVNLPHVFLLSITYFPV